MRSLTNQVGIPTVDINKPMDEPGQKFNASTLYFNAGLRLNFENVRAKTRPSENGTSSKPKKSKKSKSSKYQLNDPDNGAEIK